MSYQRDSVDQALLEHLAQLTNETTRQTGLLAELKGLSLNDVIQSGTMLLDADGRAHVNTSTAYASVGAWAYGAQVTLTNATPEATRPPYGRGVIHVPAGSSVVWPLVGADLTVHGTPGGLVLVTLWSKPQPPMVASGALLV